MPVLHWRRMLLVGVALFGAVRSSTGQVAPARAAPYPGINWWEGGLIVVGVATLSGLMDEPVDEWVRAQRGGSEGTARLFKKMGEPQVYLTVAGGVLVSGLVSGDPALQRAGVHVLGSLAVAGAVNTTTKFVTGRLRPSSTDDIVFAPFSGNDAFPSGHTAMAFALAASLSDEIKQPWASVILYAGATGTAWSRVHDHRHWLSDVAAGALVGIASAKFVNGKWRIFGIRAPQFLVGPQGAQLGWQTTF